MIVYKGLNSSFNLTENGFPGFLEDIELLEESIRQILMTTKGERVMLPNFGTNLISLVFEHDKNFIENEIRDEIYSAIKYFEPRVIVEKKDIEIFFNGDNEIIINVNFKAITKKEGFVSLKFPINR